MMAVVQNGQPDKCLNLAARIEVERSFGWNRAAERFEAAYGRALAFKSLRS